DRVLDDRRREAMSAVGELIHAGSLPCRAIPSNLVSVTMPSGFAPEQSFAATTGIVLIGWIADLRQSCGEWLGAPIAVMSIIAIPEIRCPGRVLLERRSRGRVSRLDERRRGQSLPQALLGQFGAYSLAAKSHPAKFCL